MGLAAADNNKPAMMRSNSHDDVHYPGNVAAQVTHICMSPLKLPRCIHTLLLVILAGCSSVPDTPRLTALSPPKRLTNAELPQSTLTLVSLNMAHGRGDGFSQVFLDDGTIRNNLGAIATYLSAVDADIVAVQEADGPSTWSGNFDHLQHVATASNFQQYVRTEHVKSWWGNYGTGVLSRLPILESFGGTFKATPPTTRKGFTLASIAWYYDACKVPKVIDVVSLHLDFLRESKRKHQIQELKLVLAKRSNPAIVMGDFNSEWIATSFTTNQFSHFRMFSSYQQHYELPFSFGDQKLDWVLLSEELEFVDYVVDDVVLSDHRPIFVKVKHAQKVSGK